MKLELKHLAPYLPYELEIIWQCWFSKTEHRDSRCKMTANELHNFDPDNGYMIVPILHPLSDLTKEIEHNGEKFVPIDWIEENMSQVHLTKCINTSNRIVFFNETTKTSSVLGFEYGLIQKLFEWHFDVFNLIQNGLAVDINKLSL